MTWLFSLYKCESAGQPCPMNSRSPVFHLTTTKRIKILTYTIAALLLLASFSCNKESSQNSDNDRVAFEEPEAAHRNLGGRLIEFQGEPVRIPSLPNISGTSVTPLEQSRGKVIILNMWATWCPPCVRELPSLARLYNDLKESGLELYAINMSEPAKEVVTFNANFKPPFPVLLDLNGILYDQLGFETLPTTIILDKKGQMRFMAMGYVDWDKPKVRRQIEDLIEEN